jgi:hypothetical protein
MADPSKYDVVLLAVVGTILALALLACGLNTWDNDMKNNTTLVPCDNTLCPVREP